jgi:hypothetical protein
VEYQILNHPSTNIGMHQWMLKDGKIIFLKEYGLTFSMTRWASHGCHGFKLFADGRGKFYSEGGDPLKVPPLVVEITNGIAGEYILWY